METAIAVAARLGLDLRGHRSRPLRRRCLAETDLIVGFEQGHAAEAVEVGDAAPERVFLLLELPPLLKALPQVRPSASPDASSVIRELDRVRAEARPATAPSLADPLGEPEQVMAEAARVIDAVTGALAAALLPGRAAAP